MIQSGKSKGQDNCPGMIRPDMIIKLRQNPAFNYVMLALLGVGIGLLSLLLGASIFGLPRFWSYFSSPMLMLLNLLPPIILIFLVYFISGRAWIAFTFPSLLILALSMVQFFKLQVRGDPFILSDITIVREAGTIVTAYTLTMNWKIYLAIAAFVCGIIFSVFCLKHKLKSAPFRIIAAIAAVAVSGVLYATVYTDADLYSKISVDTEALVWRPALNYVAKGYLYPFINSIKSSLNDMKWRYPDWYDEKEAEKTLESYDKADIPDDRKVNIISILLEAYCDLSVFDALDFNEDVYGPLHRLQEESVSGSLMDNIFGGGTIDTERLFLTGYTRLTTYRVPTSSYVYYLKSQGYYAEGLHSGDKWFYDRSPINARLGFDRYLFLDDYENGSRYDWFFFPAVLDMYRARDTGAPYFSFNVSYQNHGAYDTEKTGEPYVIARGGLSDESFNILNNYLRGIADTTRRIESLVDSLRDDPEPVVVILFGDHKPWLGNQYSVYNELGININSKTEEGYFNYFSTPYIIWANDAAKARLGNDFKGGGGSFSPCFLMVKLFDLCSWEGEAYIQALRELRAEVDVINEETGQFRENGAITQTLSPSAEAVYRKILMMEIYRRNHFAY